MGIANMVRSCLTLISPKLNAKVLHNLKTGRRLNFKNPVNLADKLVVLKIKDYNHNPLVKQCADKYSVREYVRSKGYEDVLNELIGVYDNVEDIEWNMLPNQFVLKWNFGCGFNVICRDKANMDIPKTVIQLCDGGGTCSFWVRRNAI